MDITSKNGGFAEFRVVCTTHPKFFRIAFSRDTWPGKAFLLTMVGDWVKIIEVTMTNKNIQTPYVQTDDTVVVDYILSKKEGDTNTYIFYKKTEGNCNYF